VWTERAPSWHRAGHAGVRQRWSWLPEGRDNWWWVLGVLVWPRNRGSVIAVEVSIIPKAKESTTSEEQSQSDADCFFFTTAELCVTNTHQKARVLTNSIIKWFSIVFMMQFGARDRTCGSHTTGSGIMTTPPPILRVWSKISWASMEFPGFARLLTLQTWLVVISGCPPSWRCRWKSQCNEHVLHKHTHWLLGSDWLTLEGYKKSRMRTRNYCRTLLSFALASNYFPRKNKVGYFLDRPRM
jgi:hypothetical protein